MASSAAAAPPALLSRPTQPVMLSSKRAKNRSSLISQASTHTHLSVLSAQEEATRVWRSDLRSLLVNAKERFADVCWTTVPLQHQMSDTESVSDDTPAFTESNYDNSSDPSFHEGRYTLIWAHKAILYARAPNTFQQRYLKLRSPKAQLHHLGSTASLVSLPAIRSEAPMPVDVDNRSTMPVHQRSSALGRVRKTVRGSTPPSSFSMGRATSNRPSSRISSLRNSANGSSDEAASITSAILTSDSETEGFTSVYAAAKPRRSSSSSPSSLTTLERRLVRMPSFASTSEDSVDIDAQSITSDASTIRAPMSLNGVSQAFFESTLEYLYTGEEGVVDAFEFIFQDPFSTEAETAPEKKIEKLRSDMTFMWRSKLYSDVKIVLDSGDNSGSSIGHPPNTDRAMPDIPDANASMVSLGLSIDTERMDSESEAGDDDVTSFSSHRMMLASRSPYFASLLLSPYADASHPVLSLPSPPFTPASLHFALGFLYTGTLFFSNRTFDLTTAFQLWRAGAYLQVDTLQSLVSALIAQDFCHNFVCSPPCRKCTKRVPRTLVFAASPDVSDMSLTALALAAVSGPDFGFYWAKEVGNLDLTTQNNLIDLVCERVEKDPSQIVSVLRQLSIVGRRIDTERASRWIDSLRSMSEIVESKLVPILESKLEQIVQSPAWTDLLDGIGNLDGVLEKVLVMLIDGLRESRAARIYQILVGQVLLRDQGFDVVSIRQTIEDARSSIIRYLKCRWVNVRALSGFNSLEKWCLKEISDELDVPTQDLILPQMPSTPPLAKARAGLKSVASGQSVVRDIRAASQRRASSATPSATKTATNARPNAPVSSSRLRASSSKSTLHKGLESPALPATARADGDGEREPGPIHLRAAVLNRNAAKISVFHGHHSSLASSSPSPQMPTSPPIRTTSMSDRAKIRTTPAGPSNPLSAKRSTEKVSPDASPAAAVAVASSPRNRTTSASSSASSKRAVPSGGQTTSRVGPKPSAGLSSPSTAKSRPPLRTTATINTTSTPNKAETKATVSLKPQKSLDIHDSRSESISGRLSRFSSDETFVSVQTVSSRARTPARISDPADHSAGPKADRTLASQKSETNINATRPLSGSAQTLRAAKSTVSLRSVSSIKSLAASTPERRPVSSLGKKASSASIATRTISATTPNLTAAPTRPTAVRSGTTLQADTNSNALNVGSPLNQRSASQTSPPEEGSTAKHSFLRAAPKPRSGSSTSANLTGKPPCARTVSGNSAVSQKGIVRAGSSTKKADSSRPSSLARADTVKPTLAASTPRKVLKEVQRQSIPSIPSDELSFKEQKSVKAAAVENDSMDMDDPCSTDVASQNQKGCIEARNDPVPIVYVDDQLERVTPSSSEEFDPDQTITMSEEQATSVRQSAASDSASIITKLGGTSLSLGIPCIVSPQNRKTGKKLATRFRATVKYIGPLMGFQGAWVGIEVATPLPKALLCSSLSDGSNGRDGDDTSDATKEDQLDEDILNCPGGLNDGTVDGVRYFDLTQYWDSMQESRGNHTRLAATSTSTAPATTTTTGSSTPCSSLEQNHHHSQHLPSYPPASYGTERANLPYLKARNGKKMYRYPERPELKARRKRIMKLVSSSHPTNLSSCWIDRDDDGDTTLQDSEGSDYGREEGPLAKRRKGRHLEISSNSDIRIEDDDDDDQDDADTVEIEIDIREQSRGLFIRPSDVLWVVSSD